MFVLSAHVCECCQRLVDSTHRCSFTVEVEECSLVCVECNTAVEKKNAVRSAASMVLDDMNHVWELLVEAFAGGPENIAEVNRLKYQYDRLEEKLSS